MVTALTKTWEGSFKITHEDFPGLPNQESFIACNTLLRVTDAYLVANNATSVGHLPRDIIGDLIDHVENCEVLTDEEKEIAIDGLSGAL